MRFTALLLLIPFAGCLVAGCGNKAGQTSAVQVASQPDRSAKQADPAAPPQPPAPKPIPGKGKFVATKSGLKYKDIMIGRGAEATSGQTVTVHYKGWLDNGTVFDSSRSHGEPFSFSLGNGQVIRGWDEGVVGMRVGGVREIIVPPDLGYGDEDKGTIPPNSTLHFEIELLRVGG